MESSTRLRRYYCCKEHPCASALFHRVLPPACTRQLYLIRKHVLVAAQRRRSPPHPPAKGKCNLTCSRKPIKVKKVRANEWVNWLRLSTRASASERLRTHSPAPQPRQSQETQRQLCWRLSSQKSFPNKRLFHLPTKHYHVWEGNTQQPFQIHNGLWQGKKIFQPTLQMVVTILPSLNSSIYFQLKQHLLQHCGSGLSTGSPSYATLECEQWIPYH